MARNERRIRGLDYGEEALHERVRGALLDREAVEIDVDVVRFDTDGGEEAQPEGILHVHVQMEWDNQ